MKNRIKKESIPIVYKITIELLPYQYEGLKEMADYMGATVEQTVNALVDGQPEDYLGRKNDDIWLCLIDSISDRWGDTPRMELVRRHQQACDANADLPSIAERRELWDGALEDADTYAAYIAKLAKRGFSIERDRTVEA